MKTAACLAILGALVTGAAAHPGADGDRHPTVHDDRVLTVTNPDGPALILDPGACLIGPARIGSNQGRPVLEIAAGQSYPPGCGGNR
jgi:hypothetical protein